MAETKIQLAKFSDVTDHTSKTNNPHSVTKAQVGLGNVLNVASYSKTEVDNKIASENADWKANDEQIKNDAIQREQAIVDKLGDGTITPLKANWLDNGGKFNVTENGATTTENIYMAVETAIVNNEYESGKNVGFGFNYKGAATILTGSGIAIANALDNEKYHCISFPDFKGDSYQYYFPHKNGTLALTSDIPSKTISQSNGYTLQGMQKAIDSGAGAGLQLWQSSALDSYVSLTSDSVKIKNPTKIELNAPTISSSGNIAINSQTAQFKAGSTEYNNGSIKFTNSSIITGSSSYELGVTIPGHKSSATAVYPGRLKLINKMTSSVDSGGTYTTTIELPSTNTNLTFESTAGGAIVTSNDLANGTITSISTDEIDATDTITANGYISSQTGINIDKVSITTYNQSGGLCIDLVSPPIIKFIDDTNGLTQEISFDALEESTYFLLPAPTIRKKPGSTLIATDKWLEKQITMQEITWYYPATDELITVQFLNKGEIVDFNDNGMYKNYQKSLFTEDDSSNIRDIFVQGVLPYVYLEGDRCQYENQMDTLNTGRLRGFISHFGIGELADEFAQFSIGVIYPARGTYNGMEVIGIIFNSGETMNNLKGDLKINTATILYHNSNEHALATAVSFAIRNNNVFSRFSYPINTI